MGLVVDGRSVSCTPEQRTKGFVILELYLSEMFVGLVGRNKDRLIIIPRTEKGRPAAEGLRQIEE